MQSKFSNPQVSLTYFGSFLKFFVSTSNFLRVS